MSQNFILSSLVIYFLVLFAGRLIIHIYFQDFQSPSFTENPDVFLLDYWLPPCACSQIQHGPKKRIFCFSLICNPSFWGPIVQAKSFGYLLSFPLVYFPTAYKLTYRNLNLLREYFSKLSIFSILSGSFIKNSITSHLNQWLSNQNVQREPPRNIKNETPELNSSRDSDEFNLRSPLRETFGYCNSILTALLWMQLFWSFHMFTCLKTFKGLPLPTE